MVRIWRRAWTTTWGGRAPWEDGSGSVWLPRQLGSPLGQEVAFGGQLRPGRRGSVIDQAPTITRPFFTGYPTWSQRQRLVSLSVPAVRFGLEGGCGLPSGPCQGPWWTHPADPIAAFQFNTVVTAIQSSQLRQLRETPTLDPQVNNPREPERNSFAQHPQALAKSPSRRLHPSTNIPTQHAVQPTKPAASCRAAHELWADPVDGVHGAPPALTHCAGHLAAV